MRLRGRSMLEKAWLSCARTHTELAMNGDDKVLLDGSSSKVTFKKSGKRKAFLSCTALVIILALLIGIGFVPGLLVGKVIYGNHEESSSDWGADVSVGGKTVPVVEWLDTELQPSNIKDNLRCMSVVN